MNGKIYLKKHYHYYKKIFDLEKIMNDSNSKILENYLKHVSQSQILPFSTNIRDYNQSRNNTEDEEMIIKYIEKIIDCSKDNENIIKTLSTKCYIEKNKKLLCNKIEPLLKIFLNNYENSEKFKYDNLNKKSGWTA
eukprot:466077_1